MIEQTTKPVDDRETETKPAATIAFRSADLNEFSEHVALLVRRNSDAGVPHLDAHMAAAPAAADDHRPAVGVLHRIGDDVEHDALKQDEVGADPRAACDDPQAQALLTRCRREGRL